MKREIGWLAAFVGAPLLLGALGSVFTSSSLDAWYHGLAMPPFAPPDWLFGPVWTALYIMMGVAAFLVWRRRREVAVGRPMAAFAVQLALNAVWSPAFFGLRSAAAGLVVIVPLSIAIAWCAVLFRRVSRPAAILMLPYLAWVSFATVLNAGIWWMNR